jgi:DNA replication protein DnaC
MQGTHSTYPKVAVQWLNQASCFYQSLCLVDSEVLRNRHLRVAAKRFLATALGYQACIQGYKVSYFNTTKLFAKLKMAKADGSYLRELTKLEKQDVIILDDFGLQALDSQNRITLLEIIEDRHNNGSVIVTSQIPVQDWYDIIGEKTIADAILDRLIHQSHRLELMGESMRKKKL